MRLAAPPHQLVSELNIELVPEGRRIFGNLTVRENLTLATYARKDEDALKGEMDKLFDLFFRLKERELQLSESLSGGEQQMLAVGRALMIGCELLLLDEPSMGLSPLLKHDLFRTLKRLNAEEGMTSCSSSRTQTSRYTWLTGAT